MNFVEVIAKKRDGSELCADEIREFVDGAATGRIGDEQLAALLMAIAIRGASASETQVLVEAMRDSGELWDLGAAAPGCVDKHSTGGVGDSVSLAFAPLVAACGVPVAMMAGAGLGHTQGTLDKLAAIPGFRPVRDRRRALEVLDSCGACLAAQSDSIAPADRTLYALRDLTGSVPSLPLIVASIMSKKLAVGAGSLVLDVKWGSGAFSRTLEEGRRLASSLVEVGQRAGMPISALLTDMNEPLGRRLGTASEVRAAVAVLEGNPEEKRLAALTMKLAEEALVQAGRQPQDAERTVRAVLESGRAREAFDAIVRAHGGDPGPRRLPRPRQEILVSAEENGYLSEVAAADLGWVAVELGAGRRTRSDTVDFGAGLAVWVRCGELVEFGQPMATVELGDRPVDVEAVVRRVRSAFVLSETAPAPRPLVTERVGAAR